MKFYNIKNGVVAELVSENTKFKTVEIQKEGENVTVSMASSTFKRWWKKVEGQQEESAEKKPVEKKPAEKKSSTKTKSQDQEVVDKPKAKKGGRPRLMQVDTEPVMEYIRKVAESIGAIEYVREKQPYLHNYKVQGNENFKAVVFLVVQSRNRVEIHSKSKWLSEDLNSKLIKVSKNNFDVRYIVKELTDDSKKVISDIIKTFK